MGETGGRKSEEESWGDGKSRIISGNSRDENLRKNQDEGGNPQEESQIGGIRKPLEKSVGNGKHGGGVEESRRILEGTKGNPGEFQKRDMGENGDWKGRWKNSGES